MQNSSTAPDTRIYTIGDIHGCSDLLDGLMAWIERDVQAAGAARNVLVFLGDYVDRGPDTVGVLDRLVAGFPFVQESVFLRGNHEAMLLGFLDRDPIGYGWLANGGIACLQSYGVTVPPDPALASARSVQLREELKAVFPPHHKYFLEKLSSLWVNGDYLFVHAGIRPGLSLLEQSEDDLIWIREDFLDSPYDFGKVVVHGHTVNHTPVLRANRIGIDTGACITGVLTCLVLERDDRQFAFTTEGGTRVVDAPLAC